MSLLLIAFVGLAVDGGEIQTQQRESQNAADGAALAAATAIINSDNYGYSTNDAKNIGWTVANYANIPSGDVTFTFLDATGNPTTTPSSVATVKADVSHTFPTLFLPVMDINTATVGAHAAVSITQNTSVNCGLCALSTSAAPAIDAETGGAISVTGGAIKSDSSGSPSINIDNGNSSITSDTAVTSVGPVSGTTSPVAVTGAAQSFSDPLSSVPTPTLGDNASSITYGTNTTINPGTYGDITVNSGVTVTMRPGIYIFAGALTVNGTLNGNNVFIYFTCRDSTLGVSKACTGASGGAININSSMTVSAPAAGSSYTGMVIFIDRQDPTTITLGTSATITPTGTIYGAAAKLVIGHGSHDSLTSRVVLSAVQVINGGRLTIAYTSSGNYVAPGKIKLTT